MTLAVRSNVLVALRRDVQQKRKSLSGQGAAIRATPPC
jgi:hypothetical protein